jgi:hypothetical protein
MRILFAGDFRWNGGSSHTIKAYADVAPTFGCSVRVSAQYGSLDRDIGNFLSVCEDDRWADHVVLVFESFQYLSASQRRRIRTRFGRDGVTIVDPDGRYGPTVRVGSDSNHREHSRASWRRLYESLSDRVLQPRLGAVPPGATFFPYFSMPFTERATSPIKEMFTIQYVGNNWYRWNTLKRFLDSLAPERHRFGRIAVCGMRWGGGSENGFENDTASDLAFLASQGVDVFDSVPFGSVVDAMSRSQISPIFVRPMISAQRLITPRMFETLCAETIPVFLAEDRYIGRLFGSGAGSLCLGKAPTASLLKILAAPEHYRALARRIRQRLAKKYRTDQVFERLVRFISTRGGG